MKFICDIMLGKLAKYLRIVGMDASYSSSLSLSQIIAAAAAEQRTVLTRRTGQLLSEQQASSYFIQSNYPYEQLQDVIRHFNLQPDSSRFFTRCILCNELPQQLIKLRLRKMSLIMYSVRSTTFRNVPAAERFTGKERIITI